MGYIFQVEYKKGMDNQVADALSRKEDPPQTTMFLLSFPQLSWLDELQQSYAIDPDLNKIIQGIQNGNSSFQAYSYNGNVLVYKDRVVLGQNSPLKSRVLHYIHDSPFVGHSGFEKTYQRAKREFFWKGMKKDSKKHVKECDTCQRKKVENLAPMGLLQPLPIPEQPWADISMDLIEGLPKSHHFDVIFVAVDRLT